MCLNLLIIVLLYNDFGVYNILVWKTEGEIKEVILDEPEIQFGFKVIDWNTCYFMGMV